VFAVAWGGEETVDEFFVGVWCGVVEEGVDLGWGWRETGEVEGDAAEPEGRRGGGLRGDASGGVAGGEGAVE
jgi:hypothetical protein